MKTTIDKCPVCGSERLEQRFRYHSGEFRTGSCPPPSLDGCVCLDCGTRNGFNKSGICPRCNGECKELEEGFWYLCSICEGKGKI